MKEDPSGHVKTPRCWLRDGGGPSMSAWSHTTASGLALPPFTPSALIETYSYRNEHSAPPSSLTFPLTPSLINMMLIQVSGKTPSRSQRQVQHRFKQLAVWEIGVLATQFGSKWHAVLLWNVTVIFNLQWLQRKNVFNMCHLLELPKPSR